ncbi:MAG: glycosyltransferase family 2 protein [Deltaproteobacteria bacterium]|nr:glycosyltransferase family 2 protein [Deltaproteobacteria bacterium]
MKAVEAIFWISVFLVFFSYFGYPISLWLLGRIHRKGHVKRPVHPQVTIIITAYNEEKRIKDKLENTLSLIYPKGKLQILVASDGSTDRTNEITESYRGSGVELLAIKTRAGKESAQRDAMKAARGEIIVFTDVATIIEPNGIEEIVSNFADPEIGCVSSEDRLLDRDGKPSGEGFYVRYEMVLRRLESRVNSLVGLSGSFFAARRAVCIDLSPDMQSDFRTLLNSRKMGLRGVSDPAVTGSYLDVSEKSREFDRKVRTVLRGLTVFFRHLEFLNFFRYGFFSYQYFCHKLLRWLVPCMMMTALTANAFLLGESSIYATIFVLQILFYCFALLGWRKNGECGKLLKIPYYFVSVNLSIFVAWLKYIGNQRVVMWNPSDR